MAQLIVGGICAILTLLACGCGDGVQSGRIPVSGIVTLDGSEVSGGRVLFTPQKGTPGPVAAGTIDETGMYRIASEQGPGTGAYNVKISVGKIVPENKFDLTAGQSQTFNQQTVIAADRAGGLNFDLVTPPKQPRPSRR